MRPKQRFGLLGLGLSLPDLQDAPDDLRFVLGRQPIEAKAALVVAILRQGREVELPFDVAQRRRDSPDAT